MKSQDPINPEDNSPSPTPEVSTSSFDSTPSGDFAPEDPLSPNKYNEFAVEENLHDAQAKAGEEKEEARNDLEPEEALDELTIAQNELAALEAEEKRRRENMDLGGVSSSSVADIDVDKYRNLEFSEEDLE